MYILPETPSKIDALVVFTACICTNMSSQRLLALGLVHSARLSLNHTTSRLFRKTTTFRQGSRTFSGTRSTASFFNTPVRGLGGNFRVSTVFTALLVLGTGTTAFGLYVVFCRFSRLSVRVHFITVISSIHLSHYGRRNYAVTCVPVSKPKIKVISV